MFKRLSSAMLLAVSSLAAGCMMEVEPDAEALVEGVEIAPLAGGGDGTGGTGIISGNGASALTPELLALYTPVASLLTLTSLTGLNLELSELITTVGGRSLLHYLVQCALPAGESVTTSFLGITNTYDGLIGIAPEWKSGPLSTSSRRWLSACVLAHVNATGQGVSILLRGNHPALNQPIGSGGSAYTLREGAFYGDIFGLLALSHACGGDGSTPSRVCTNNLLGLSPCGFLVPGNCRGLQNTCEGVTDGYYTNCHAGLLLPLLPSTNYPEAITVYLQP